MFKSLDNDGVGYLWSKIKTYVSNNFLGKTDKASSASVADSATTATTAITATTANSLSGFTNNTNTNTALDSMTNNGIWYTSSNAIPAVQSTNNDGMVEVKAYSTNWITQLYHSFRGFGVWRRSKQNGVWNSWVKLVDRDDLKSKGSATQPVYFDASGIAQNTTYTLGKSVPSNAVFTDTVCTESTVSGWGFTKNTGTITGITMNGASVGTSGNVNLGSVAKSINSGTLISATNNNHVFTINHNEPTGAAKTSSGLYKISTDACGHVTGTTAVAKADITALGIPSTNTTYSVATTSANGLMSSTDKTKLDAIDMTTKQDVLVSGTSIKTINGNSLLGSGNIEISGGGGSSTEIITRTFTSNVLTIQAGMVGPGRTIDIFGPIGEDETPIGVIDSKGMGAFAYLDVGIDGYKVINISYDIKLYTSRYDSTTRKYYYDTEVDYSNVSNNDSRVKFIPNVFYLSNDDVVKMQFCKLSDNTSNTVVTSTPTWYPRIIITVRYAKMDMSVVDSGNDITTEIYTTNPFIFNKPSTSGASVTTNKDPWLGKVATLDAYVGCTKNVHIDGKMPIAVSYKIQNADYNTTYTGQNREHCHMFECYLNGENARFVISSNLLPAGRTIKPVSGANWAPEEARVSVSLYVTYINL